VPRKRQDISHQEAYRYKEMPMQRTLIAAVLQAHAPQSSVTVCGWIRTRRNAKGFCCLELNDGSCLATVQCIVDEGTPAFTALGAANTGAGLRVEGSLAASPGRGQAWELRVMNVEVYGVADP
jgi:asparaginyl-tRNA synthetase